jgi:hypothetical protein
MPSDDTDMTRRSALQIATGAAVVALAAGGADAMPPTAGQPEGGEFGFLAGNWTIKNKKLKAPGTNEWQEFEGSAKVVSVLGGLASIEELRGPKGKFFGMGVRVFDIEKKKWADHWVSASVGVVNLPQMGSFKDGVGTFLAEEGEGADRMIYRGVWDRVTPRSCRWHQSSSKDGGKTWDYDWYMDWTRV